MSTVLEIERAIESLPAEEFRTLAAWIQGKLAVDADRIFEHSILAGKFDHLAEQALQEIAAGETTPMDEFLRNG